MDWHYAYQNDRRGPVTEEALRGLAEAGEIQPQTLVWSQGMNDWAPYSAVLGGGAGIAGPNFRCTECGGAFAESDLLRINNSLVCAACKPVYLQKVGSGLPTGGAQGLWRRGKQLIIARDSALPARCVKCNGTETITRLKRNLSWHHPAVYIALVVNVLVYILIAMLVRKRMTVFVGLCERHRGQRLQWIVASWVMLLASIAIFVVGAANQMQNLWAWLTAAAIFIASLIIAVAGPARVITPAKIDEKYARVNGVCKAYLAELSEWTGL